MTTVVVYEKGNRAVLAAVPLAEGEAAICRNDVGFQIYSTERNLYSQKLRQDLFLPRTYLFSIQRRINTMKNKKTLIIIGIVAAFILVIAGIFISTNNRAISLEEQIFTADSDIQA